MLSRCQPEVGNPHSRAAYRAQTMPWRMKSTKKTTMKERSNIPTGGMMLRDIGEEPGDRRERTSRTHREPRQDGARGEQDQIDAQNPADELHDRQARYRPRACNRSLSSSETSTLVGVKRNTWSSTFRIVPPTAYAKPLEKSIKRR
jgi:hypothetical protein